MEEPYREITAPESLSIGMLKKSVSQIAHRHKLFITWVSRKNNGRIREIFVYRAQILNICNEPSVSSFLLPPFIEMFY